jgi:hypothetical protein
MHQTDEVKHTLYYQFSQHIFKLEVFGEQLDWYLDHLNLLEVEYLSAMAFHDNLIEDILQSDDCRVSHYRLSY